MKTICIDKVTLNIGVGGPGDKLEKAIKLLQVISGQKPVKTTSIKRIPTWGVRPGLALATKVTVRGKKAEELLKRLLQATGENTLPERKFDDFGNFSFGIPEYIDIPGVAYDVTIGIIGLEVAVTLKRAGYRVKIRKTHTHALPKRHKITKTEAQQYVRTTYGTKVGEEEQ